MWALPTSVSPVHLNNSPLLVNVFPPARLELLALLVLAFSAILIALAALDPLSTSVQHAPRNSLFSRLDVASQRVAKPSSLIALRRHARPATRVAQAALVPDLVTV